MIERKKAGWGYCRDCYRARMPNGVCYEVANKKTPPCVISTLSAHLKFEELLKERENVQTV